MKCDQCGIESGLEQAFTRRRGPRFLCPTCSQRDQLYSLVTTGVLIAGGTVVSYLAHPSSSFTTLSLGFVLVVVAMIPLTLLHELAHVAVGRAFGQTTVSVTIGFGRRLVAGEFLSIFWDLRLLPLGGQTRIVGASPPYMRLKAWLGYAAGPAVHLVLAIAAWELWSATAAAGTSDQVVGIAAWALFHANVILLVVNLLPLRVPSPLLESGTDGWNMAKLPFVSGDEFRRMTTRHYLGAAVVAVRRKQFDGASKMLEAAKANDPSDPEIPNVSGVVSLARGELQEARAAFSSALASQGESFSGSRYLLMNNLAYVDALLEDPVLMEEAERLSREAFDNGPWISAFAGTRGAVLGASGRYAEAEALLRRAMREADGVDSKAETAYLLALAEARQGRAAEALETMSLARRLDPRSPVRGIVEGRLVEVPGGLAARAEALPVMLREEIRSASATPSVAATPGVAPRSLHWYESVDMWSRMIFAWAMWNLIAYTSYTISPAIAFFILSGFLSYFPGPAVVLAAALTALLIGVHALVNPPSGLWFAGLYLLVGSLALVGYSRLRKAHPTLRPLPDPASQPRGRTRKDLPVPLLAGIMGTASILLQLCVLLYIVVVVFSSGGPVSVAFNRLMEDNPWVSFFEYATIAFALIGVAAGAAAQLQVRSYRGWAVLGILTGGLVVLLLF